MPTINKEVIVTWLNANASEVEDAKTTQQVAAGVKTDPYVAYEILIALKAEGNAKQIGRLSIDGAKWWR